MAKGEIIYRNSTYIENILRHQFVAEVACELWRKKPGVPLHVLQAEVDIAGIDVMFIYEKIFRHIQFKALSKANTENPYAIHESLGGKAGAAVIWICYDKDTLQSCGYHMMGKRGNGELQSLLGFAIAKSPKSKKERPGYRSVRIRDADSHNLNLGKLVEILFDL